MLFGLQRVVKGDVGGREIDLLGKGAGLGTAEDPLHTAVLPLDGQGAVIAHLVEHPDDVVEVHVAVAGGNEIPAPPLIPEGNVGAQDAVAAVEVQLGILDVDVVDPVGKVKEEHGRIQALPDQMTGVKVDAQGGAVIKGLQQLFGAPVVIGDLSGMDLQRQLDAVLVIHIHNMGDQSSLMRW